MNHRPSRRQMLATVLAGTAVLGGLAFNGCAPVAKEAPVALKMLALIHPVPACAAMIEQNATAAARRAGATLSYAAVDLTTLRQRLAAAVAANQLPDLALVGPDEPAPLALHGQLWDLRPTLDRLTGLLGPLFGPLADLAAAGPAPQPNLPPGTLGPAWGVPFASLGNAWLIRTDLFKAKGVLPPGTYDQLLAFVPKLTDATHGAFGWGTSLAASPDAEALVANAVFAFGASIFDDLGARIVLAGPEAAAAVQAMASLYQVGATGSLAPPGAIDWSPAQVEAAFRSGQTAIVVDSAGLYARIASDQPELIGQIQALAPPGGPKRRVTLAETSFLVAFRSKGKATTSNTVAQLIEDVLQPALYRPLMLAGRGAVVPPFADQTKDPFWNDDPNYQIFALNTRGDPLQNMTFASLGYPGPATPAAALVDNAGLLTAAARSVVQDRAAPAAAVKAAARRAQMLLDAALQAEPTPGPAPGPFPFLKGLVNRL